MQAISNHTSGLSQQHCLQLFAVVEELVAARSRLLPGAALEAQAKRIIMRLLHDFAGFVKGDPRVAQMILEIVFVVKAGAVGHRAAFGGLHEFELVVFVDKAAEVWKFQYSISNDREITKIKPPKSACAFTRWRRPANLPIQIHARSLAKPGAVG